MRTVTLNFGGRQLKMRTDADDALLTEIADEVDARLRQLSDGGRQPGPDELLFAVISLANDLVIMRRDLDRIKTDVRTIAEAALADLDANERDS